MSPGIESRFCPLRLFVYGSLKHGFSNYGRYCRGAGSVEEAQIEGRLFQLPSGYPVLVLPQSRILVRGTCDVVGDLRSQAAEKFGQTGVSRSGRLGESRVHGQLLTFAGSAARLRAIDGLEQFRPGRKNPYKRVLIEVYSRTRQAPVTAWTYVAGDLSTRGRLILTGKWTANADRRPKPPWPGSSGPPKPGSVRISG